MFYARLELPASLNEQQVLNFSDIFDGLSAGCVSRRIDHDDTKPWLIEWYFETKPDPHALLEILNIQKSCNDNLSDFEIRAADFDISAVIEENWLEKVHQEHAPFTVGPFFIYGSHYEGDVPAGQIGLKIDAATAFGSGDHGTTKGCLIAMIDLKSKGQCPWNVLDMGTGSGILSIAAWKLWQTPITAIDIDEEAIRVTERYREMNGVQGGKGAMRAEAGDGFNTPLCQRRAPYDLIIANILAGPLKEMAKDLKAVSDENGTVILSGMLKTQADSVLERYESLGFTLKDRIDIDKWSSLVLNNIS